MKQDNDVLTKCSGSRPFRVPEGYFEGLDTRIMDALPERGHDTAVSPVTAWMRIRPYLYMAAAFAGMYFVLGLFADDRGGAGADGAADGCTVYSDEYIDSFLDESMVSDFVIYDLLVNNDL